MSVVGDSRGGAARVDVATTRSRPNALARPRSVGGTVARNGERFAEVARPRRATGRAAPRPRRSIARSGTSSSSSAAILLRRRASCSRSSSSSATRLAALFARRIRRLERAAERIADGCSTSRSSISVADEVGELARAFERMRRRLAQLDHARARVHRERVARAAHAGVLARRLPGAARRRGARRGDAPRVPETMREQVRPAREARRPSCSISPGSTRATSTCAESRVARRGRADGAAEFAAVAPQTATRWRSTAAAARAARATSSACCRSRASSSRTRSFTPRRDARRVSTPPRGGRARSRSPTTGPVSRSRGDDVFERFYRVDGRSPRAAGSGSRSRSELAAAHGRLARARSRAGRTAFVVTLPAADAATGRNRARARAPFSRGNGCPISGCMLAPRSPFHAESRQRRTQVARRLRVDRRRAGSWRRSDELAAPLAGKRVLHLSATAFGGGVAEINYTLVPLMPTSGSTSSGASSTARRSSSTSRRRFTTPCRATRGPDGGAAGDLRRCNAETRGSSTATGTSSSSTTRSRPR